MTAGVHHPLREHLPRPSRRALAGGALIAVLAIVLLDGSIAAWATHTARQQLEGHRLATGGEYSEIKHLFAMAGLSAYVVWVASALIREGQPALGVLVLAGVAAGPMSILAAPITMSVRTQDLGGTVWWWHALVQGGQFLILGLWTLWTSLCIRGKRFVTVDPMQPDQTHGEISSWVLFSLFTAITVTAQVLARTSTGIESPGLLAILGWAVLGAGGSVMVVQSAWWAMSGFIVTGGVIMLGLLYSAYYRQGGWEGVAGWQVFGQSPLILSLSASTCVLAGPLLGAMLKRRHPPAGARTEPAPLSKVADL